MFDTGNEKILQNFEGHRNFKMTATSENNVALEDLLFDTFNNNNNKGF